jgi:signal transduction histidine kinase
LADAYRAQLDRAAQDVSEHWRQQLDVAEVGNLPPSAAFAKFIARTGADSAIVWDADGGIAYPDSPTPPAPIETTPEWARAESLEFWEQNYAAAAELYRQIAERAVDEQLKARAEQALARCFVRGGQTQSAIAVLTRLSRREGVDASGRSLAADADLRLLELSETNSTDRQQAALRLQERLNWYEAGHISAEQRRFLMHRLAELAPEVATFSLLAAEDLAAEFVAAGASRSKESVVSPSRLNDVWSVTSADGRMTALYRGEHLKSRLQTSAIDQTWPESVSVSFRAPGESSETVHELMAMSLAPTMPGWSLRLEARDGAALDSAASGRRTLLLSIATVLVGATLALTAVVAGGVRRQMQLANLKNDLVATVSHELKTPLASIRLLVDTLLEEDQGEDQDGGRRRREYLELISRENARLTRLIENFLTFSRLERGKQRFAFQPIDGREVVTRAAAAVADRFNGEQAALHVEIDGPLPLCGDMDALVTAVINLLDNAWKYRGESKLATLRARVSGGHVLIEVVDQGIGLSPKAARRVFDRFYQADERLSRQHGGCGLGLSIVKGIVEAHGGTAAVTSSPGQGTTFSISLPKTCDDELTHSRRQINEPALPIGETA